MYSRGLLDVNSPYKARKHPYHAIYNNSNITIINITANEINRKQLLIIAYYRIILYISESSSVLKSF